MFDRKSIETLGGTMDAIKTGRDDNFVIGGYMIFFPNLENESPNFADYSFPRVFSESVLEFCKG